MTVFNTAAAAVEAAASINEKAAKAMSHTEVCVIMNSAIEMPYQWHRIPHGAQGAERVSQNAPFTKSADPDFQEWWWSTPKGRYELCARRGIRYIPA